MMAPAHPPEPLLEAQGVHFAGRDGAPLLDGVSLSAAAGEILAIVGPNGAGKTTLIRLLAGLTTPSRGTVRVNGRPLSDLRPAERARIIAYVGQTDMPDGRLSIRQYAALGLGPHAAGLQKGDAERQVGSVLERIGLLPLADRRMDRVSGGERQKAKIARALCQRPKLLVLDEPTNHLDPQARGALLRVIAAMGFTAVAALHDLTLIDGFAHKVAMVENGRLVAFAGPEDALSRERVRAVFGVDLYRFSHPDGGKPLAALDVMTASAGG